METLHRADGARAMRRLLEGPDVPDAVFCFADRIDGGGADVPARSILVGHRLVVRESTAGRTAPPRRDG